MSGNYADAINLYQEKISGNSTKEAEATNFTRQYMQDVLDSYASGQIDNQQAESAFDCLLKIDDKLYILNVELGAGIDQLTDLQMSKEAFVKATSAMNDGNYEEAILEFTKVAETDTEDYVIAKEQFETARNRYKSEISTKLQTASESGEYDYMIRLAKEATDVLGEADADFQNFVDSAYYKKAETLINKYIQEGKLDLAIQEYKTFSDAHSDLLTSEMSEKMSICKENFVNQIIEVSQLRYFDTGASSALLEINKGLSILEDERLDTLYQLYSSAIPVSWQDVTHHIPDSGVATHFSTFSDYWGNTYQGDLIKLYTFWMYKYPPIEIITNQQYTNFSAVLFPETGYDSPRNAQLKIYGDDVLVYDSGNIEEKTKAININIDITNVEILKIQLTAEGESCSIWLQNATLSKELMESDLQIAIQ